MAATLASLGDVDDVAVLLDPDTAQPSAIRILHGGWLRTVSAPVDCLKGKWNWNDSKFINKGHFFEEAMAQLVELQFLTSVKPLLKEPVTFEGNGITFELPVEYLHCATGWSLLKLESTCPGVVETLLAGATGDVDYGRLGRIIEGTFPGLFQELYDITLDTELVVGVQSILYRLGDRGGRMC